MFVGMRDSVAIAVITALSRKGSRCLLLSWASESSGGNVNEASGPTESHGTGHDRMARAGNDPKHTQC